MANYRTLIWTDFKTMSVPENNLSELLTEKVLSALKDKTPIAIQGSGSKSFYGRPVLGEPLYAGGHQGIVHYEPSELVITARCGTRLADLEAVLSEYGQMLAFEPPYFGSDATLGGAIATGLSGPRRPYAGSARDVVLGVKLLSGRGEILKFGGEVIKNVAGFDVARLMVGALGTLGLLLEISLKIIPRPELENTLLFSVSPDTALQQMNCWARQNWPITASSYDGELIRVRLSGAASAIAHAQKKMGGDLMSSGEADRYWSDLREHKLAFFQSQTSLWRLSLASATIQPNLSGSWLIDWGGALRWLKTGQEPTEIFQETQSLGGHASRFRSLLGGEFQPLTPGLEKLHRGLKRAFDPLGILNPGRLYAGW